MKTVHPSLIMLSVLLSPAAWAAPAALLNKSITVSYATTIPGEKARRLADKGKPNFNEDNLYQRRRPHLRPRGAPRPQCFGDEGGRSWRDRQHLPLCW